MEVILSTMVAPEDFGRALRETDRQIVPRVAFFLDIPNLETSLHEKGERLDAAALRSLAQTRGRLVAVRAYGPALANRPITRAVIDATLAGFEFVPRVLLQEGRKDIDTQMTADIVELACKDEFDVAIVGSGDSDFLPALRAARRCEKAVIVLAVSGCCSSVLSQAADEGILLGLGAKVMKPLVSPVAGTALQGIPRPTL